MQSEYEKFKELTDEFYNGCTTQQKLEVYVQHRPASVVPFLLELIRALYPEDDDTESTD